MELGLDTSVEAARAALAWIWGRVPDGELVELSVLGRPQGRGRKRRWRTVACTLEEALGPGAGADGYAALHYASAGGSDAYYGVCTLKGRPPAGRRGGAGLRGSGIVVWLDVDVAGPGRDGSNYFASVQEAVEAVDAALEEVGVGAAGALVIGSGYGAQYLVGIGERVPAPVAARLSSGLIAAVAGSKAVGGKKIDRVGDASRVLRAPGTWNWRDPEGAASGVIRWPTGRGARVDAGALESLIPAGSAGGGAGEGGRLGGAGGGPWMDIESLADDVLDWRDVLGPAGWTITSNGHKGGGDVVWARPGREGERSAVVYADGGGEMVVYSSAAECGFGRGLRGGGARGESAGVGVVSKWRALVDLGFGGDRERALAALEEGGGPDALRSAWLGEIEEALSWAAGIEELAMEKHGGSWRAEQEWRARAQAAAASERRA